MAGLGKKGCVLASQRVAYAAELYSKHALIDLAVDRARAELGEDAPDDAVLALLDEWMRPVIACRGDREISLVREDAKRADKEAKYITARAAR